jgi:hypothetical protein
MAIQYPFPHVPMLGKGSILFDRFDVNGLPTGKMPFGNCHKFEISLKDDRAELYQSLNKNSSLIANALKKRTISLSITGTDFRSDMVAIALMSGGKTLLETSVATVAAEVLASATATKHGRYFRLESRNVDNVTTPPVLTNDAIVLTVGTDYVVVDPIEGLIYFPTGSAVNEAFAVTCTYHVLAGELDQVAPATEPQILGQLDFIPDPTDGQAIGVEVWRVNLYPSGQVGFIADDYGNWTLDGAILDDTANHPEAPYLLQTFYPVG